jgi:hypothetical protein
MKTTILTLALLGLCGCGDLLMDDFFSSDSGGGGGGSRGGPRINILSVEPADGSGGVDVGTAVTVEFDRGPGSNRAENRMRLRGEGGKRVDCAFALSGYRVTLTPVAPLEPGATYVLKIEKGVHSKGQRPMKKAWKSSFTTAAAKPLRVTAVNVTLFGDRVGHTETLLPSGRVFVAGGLRDGVPTETTELRHPIDGSAEPGPALPEPRAYHTATLLPDGTVLIAGGLAGPELTPTDGVLTVDPTVEGR